MENPSLKHNFVYSFGLLFALVMLGGFGNVVFAVMKDRQEALNTVGDVTVTYEASRDKTKEGLTKFKYAWKRSFRYNYSYRPDGDEFLLRIKVRAQVNPTISHQIFMPSADKDRAWHKCLLDHEYDHVSISSDERIFKLMKSLTSDFIIKGVRVSSRDNITKEFIHARINEELNTFEDAVEKLIRVNYKLLDKISEHGLKPIPDGDLFFLQLYGPENLRRQKFAYMEEVNSLLNSKEYIKAKVSSGEIEYLSYGVPGNAVKKKGVLGYRGTYVEYWVVDDEPDQEKPVKKKPVLKTKAKEKQVQKKSVWKTKTREKQGDQNSIIAGKPFPSLEFKDLNGNTVNISKLKGKVVLIDFWATWCRPCTAETPNLLSVYKDFKKSGLEIIGINLDKDRQQLVNYLEAHQITWPNYYDGKSWKNSISSRFGIRGIPAIVLLDREGIVRETRLRGDRIREAVAGLCGGGVKR